MMMNRKTFTRGGSAAALALALAFTAASPATAGEITGNGKSLKNPDGTLNGNSLCAFSGRNDTPNGLWLPIGPNGTLVQVDPGGDVQSQAMLQVFLNVVEFGMPVQKAVESPRISSWAP